MNENDLNMNEMAADEPAEVDTREVAAADANDPVAADSPQATGRRSRKSGSLPRMLVRICLGLVTLLALVTIVFRGGNSSEGQVEEVWFVLNLQPAEIYGQAYLEFEDQRLDDESSIQRILSEQSAQGTSAAKPLVLRTAGGVSQKEIDRISRLIRQTLPETPIVIVGSSSIEISE